MVYDEGLPDLYQRFKVLCPLNLYRILFLAEFCHHPLAVDINYYWLRYFRNKVVCRSGGIAVLFSEWLHTIRLEKFHSLGWKILFFPIPQICNYHFTTMLEDRIRTASENSKNGVLWKKSWLHSSLLMIVYFTRMTFVEKRIIDYVGPAYFHE